MRAFFVHAPQQTNHRMLPPESAFKKYWNYGIVLLVMYNTLFIVLVVCYNRYNSDGLYWYDRSTGELNVTPMVFDYLVDAVFIVDIFLTFRTTFFDAENEVCTAACTPDPPRAHNNHGLHRQRWGNKRDWHGVGGKRG